MKGISIIIPLLVLCLAFAKASLIDTEKLGEPQLEGIEEQNPLEAAPLKDTEGLEMPQIDGIAGQKPLEAAPLKDTEGLEVPQLDGIKEPLNSITEKVKDSKIPEEAGKRVKRHFFYHNNYPTYSYYPSCY